MTQLSVFVIYWDYLRGKAEKDARRILGDQFSLGPLPCELNLAEMPPEQITLFEKLVDSVGDRESVLLQPTIEESEGMPRDEALRIAWSSIRQDNQFAGSDVEVELVKEYPRCWAVLFFSPIDYPGIGVVVDKHSKLPFLRRYTDLKSALLPDAPVRVP